MKLCPPLLLCLAAALSSAFVVSPPHMWTKLILTHHWPCSFCVMEPCHANISYWTLHGLWPDKGQACNSSWHFNSSQIEDLLPEMRKNWPDLLDPLSTAFWKYEWNKHGTCAAKAEALNSQHKYFSKALELYHKLDLDSILTKFNITPSDKYYAFSQIEGVIETFYGVKPKIQCIHPSKNADAQILGQIEICFHPDFTLVNCDKHGHHDNHPAVDKASEFSVCDPDMPVSYPPLS
ncbi:ribonuclease T2 [Hippoglossus hippoglossus]|uniref:ribonuclease T2 n=1 Tax=Hippoglossus hippoglossus TaxID=8267 RepID=UPI00148D696F|nr:ribonuclease T2 [Hippoglossus hippoglossus]XP_034437640.1 ribonuclease T2 [Hippoglossus hippoglossus]XP_035012505.1 ribonuclease T2 [Hippoglossus stenolepis]XP_035012513.1 ribonuclease T2 [Hippoglossus stenolepis]